MLLLAAGCQAVRVTSVLPAPPAPPAPPLPARSCTPPHRRPSLPGYHFEQAGARAAAFSDPGGRLAWLGAAVLRLLAARAAAEALPAADAAALDKAAGAMLSPQARASSRGRLPPAPVAALQWCCVHSWRPPAPAAPRRPPALCPSHRGWPSRPGP